MDTSIHDRIKVLIEETNDAFSSSGPMNADYAEFATLALSEFKHALRNPHLTRNQLVKMLRKGMAEHKNATLGGPWTAYLAHHVANTSNNNVAAPQTLDLFEEAV